MDLGNACLNALLWQFPYVNVSKTTFTNENEYFLFLQYSTEVTVVSDIPEIQQEYVKMYEKGSLAFQTFSNEFFKIIAPMIYNSETKEFKLYPIELNLYDIDVLAFAYEIKYEDIHWIARKETKMVWNDQEKIFEKIFPFVKKYLDLIYDSLLKYHAFNKED